MSEPPTQPPAPLPPELANLIRDNEQVRRACADALQAAFQAGHDAGWAKGYPEGRAVTAALAHRSGCNLNHPAGEPCEVPEPGPSKGLLQVVSETHARLLGLPWQPPADDTDVDHVVTKYPDVHTERTEL